MSACLGLSTLHSPRGPGRRGPRASPFYREEEGEAGDTGEDKQWGWKLFQPRPNTPTFFLFTLTLRCYQRAQWPGLVKIGESYDYLANPGEPVTVVGRWSPLEKMDKTALEVENGTFCF